MRVVLSIVCVFLSAQLLSVHCEGKYRVCVVGYTSTNTSKVVLKYCPTLDNKESQAECVLASDRLDCLLKISEGKADFGVFEAEDIVIASNTKNKDILITNEIRFFDDREYEFEVVAIVRNTANINKLADLQGKSLCHPGYSHEQKWTEVISRYFEARVVPQLCNSSLTLTENRIRSSSSFFQSACKPGPWVPNLDLDSKLKTKYPNLCELCDSPSSCTTLDKYWGRRGPLYCLTDGVGDVSWARLDDIKAHFGLTGMPAVAPAEDFRLLCPDGGVTPLDSPSPCVWLARPWSVIAASPATADSVQKIVSGLKNLQDQGWEWALDRLITPTSQDSIVPLPVQLTPEDFLNKVTGFTSANSLSDCTPGRPVRICTHTSIEHVKCGWMKEVATTYGIEPDLSCLRAKSVEDCMKVVQGNAADVVVTTPDYELSALRDYGLEPLLYEFSNNANNLYKAAAVVRANSVYKTLEELRGRKACFPRYKGVGWTSLVEILQNSTLLPKTCPYTKAIAEYFGDSCVPGLSNTSKEFQPSLQKLCTHGPVDSLIISDNSEDLIGEMGAFRCLATGVGEVAFINVATIYNNTDGTNTASWANRLSSKDFRPLCNHNSTTECYLSWATPGQVMIKSNTSSLRREELYIVFLQLDNLFGRQNKKYVPAFQLFGEFAGQKNVMFQDSTHRLEDYASIQRDGPKHNNYENIVRRMTVCNKGASNTFSLTALILPIIYLALLRG